MSKRIIGWGSKIIFILLPLCSCLDVQTVKMVELLPHPGEKLHLFVDFAPVTTEGWEEGEVAYGLLCARIPEGWQFLGGTWAVSGGKSGNIVIREMVKPIIEAGAGYKVVVLSSDQTLSRGDMKGEISAELTFLTSNMSNLFTLIFIGGAANINFTEAIWSNAAPYRMDLNLK